MYDSASTQNPKKERVLEGGCGGGVGVACGRVGRGCCGWK